MCMLRQIEIFLRSQGMAASRFGRIVVRDPGLVRDMRNGREVRPETAAKITAFIAGFSRQEKADA